MKVRLPKGMGGGPQDMNAMIRQAQKMQESMTEKQAELDALEYDFSAGGGMVSVKINGKKEILNITIKPELVDPEDVETLQDVIVAAVNEAYKSVESKNAAEMEKITGSLSLPGGSNGWPADSHRCPASGARARCGWPIMCSRWTRARCANSPTHCCVQRRASTSVRFV